MNIGSKNKIRNLIQLVLGSFLAAHLCFILLPNVFEILNARAVDQLFNLRSSWKKFQPVYDNTVVHLDLNNTSIQKLNDQYLNRSHYAQVVRNLSSMGVSAQVFDFILASRKSEKNDRELIDMVKEAGNVYFGTAFELIEDNRKLHRQSDNSGNLSYLDKTKWNVAIKGDSSSMYVGDKPLTTFPDLASASRGLGSLSVKFDRDGVLRRVPLIVRYKDAFYPLFSFHVICNYLDVSPEKVLVKPGKHIILGDAKKPGDKKPHDIEIPIDKKGNLIINYIGPWEHMDHYNFADVYLASGDRDELEMWKEELKGKIVIVSDVSTGSTDVGPVPTDANFPLSGVHANIIHSILTKSFLKEISFWVNLLVEVVLMGALLALSLRYSAIYFSFGTVLVIAAFIGTTAVGFLYHNVIFHIARPLLLIVFAVSSINVYRYINEEKEKLESIRQRDFIRDTFGRYMSDEVVEELLGSPDGLSLSGENREVTFLVSDLRGFTTLTEKLNPNEVIEMLNRYFKHMVEVIALYRGTVSEFLGDGILAFFGAPLNADDDVERAVACAIEMQNKLAEVNAKQRLLNLPELAMGIGINTGKVVVGNIGSKMRAKYGVVGMPINVAFRIESFTVAGQILISPTSYQKVSSIIRCREIKAVTFKGIGKPMCLYEVIGINGSYDMSLLETPTKSLTALDPPYPIDCFTIEGKTVSEIAIAGRVTHIGDSIAKVLLAHQVEAHTNLRIVPSAPKDPQISELYAKVLPEQVHKDKTSNDTLLIRFSTSPHEIRSFFS